MDVEAAVLAEKIAKWSAKAIGETSVPFIYALAQELHDRINKLEMTDAQKGSIMSHLVSNFLEFNKGSLAIFYAERDAMMEGKDATKH